MDPCLTTPHTLAPATGAATGLGSPAPHVARCTTPLPPGFRRRRRRLLDGGHGPSPLPELLAAARAPATAAELRTEPAARAAFRAPVHPDASPPPTTSRGESRSEPQQHHGGQCHRGHRPDRQHRRRRRAVAAHSSPTTPRDQSSSTTTKAATSDALAAYLTSLTTAPSTALADDHARPLQHPSDQPATARNRPRPPTPALPPLGRTPPGGARPSPRLQHRPAREGPRQPPCSPTSPAP